MKSPNSSLGFPQAKSKEEPRRVRLAYLASHPIQYQTPLLRRIAEEPGIDLTVFFGSDFSVKGSRDEGFGVDVKWDVPLLDGYKYEFLPNLRDTGKTGILSPICYGLLRRLRGGPDAPPFDILWVHGYSTANEMYGILAAKCAGIPVVVRSDSSLSDRPRGRWKLKIKRLFFQVLRQVVDGVLVSGTRNLEYWMHYMGQDFPMFMLPYAVDNAWFQQKCLDAAEQREDLQRELALSPDRPVILFASKLQARKHCDDLISAYTLLAEAPGIDPVPYLVIVGDGDERGSLEAQAKATGFSSIRFCGFRNQSEMPRFLDLCTVFVLPARHEPWGLIVNEAMNAARAIIVSDDVGCQPDLVTDNVEGCVYPVRDVPALAESLRRVLASPGVAHEMGQNALRRVTPWNFEADIAGLRQALASLTHKISFVADAPDQIGKLQNEGGA